KHLSILIVTADETPRVVIHEVLNELEFIKIQLASSPAEALQKMQHEYFDCVISTLVAAAEINALTLLSEIVKDKNLRNTKVSIFLEDKQQSCLPTAFELGLLSRHIANFSKDAVKSQI